MSFAGKVALVTGGSSGIGKATAMRLAGAGAHVFLLARDVARLDAAVADLKRAALQPAQQVIEGYSVDVADYEQVRRAVQRLRGAGYVPDYLFNFAGIAYPGYFQELPLSIHRQTMEIDYFGTLHTCMAVAPLMMARRSGHIVNTSSMAGLFAVFGYTAYGAAKYAVRGLSEILRAELKCHNVKVSILFPSDVDTPQLHFENQFKPAETRAIAATARVMTPDQVAQELLSAIQRDRLYVIPGFESKLYRLIERILGVRMMLYSDWIVRRVQRPKGGPKPIDPDQCVCLSDKPD